VIDVFKEMNAVYTELIHEQNKRVIYSEHNRRQTQ